MFQDSASADAIHHIKDAATQDARRRITIVGAGVAGAWQALSFAKAGYSVKLFERDDAAMTHATSHFAGRLMHLVRIAVLPQYRGQAIGVRLLADVVEFARVRGADLMTLNTQSYNTEAQRLYEWFGFRRTGERQAILRFDL